MAGGHCTFPILAAALLFSIYTASPVFADERCQRLETLAQQYAGVGLTSSQQLIKPRMVVWYEHNCRTNRSADAN